MDPIQINKKIAAVVILEDGTLIQGNAAGKIGTATGEICFNTGMTGYQEIFTDPSYYGQVLVNTNAHIGNYGTSVLDNESGSVKIMGLIVKNFSTKFSRQLSDAPLQDYLEKNNIVAVTDIDTRALVKYIRDKGAMNVIISSETDKIEELKDKLAKVPSMAGLELASKVSTKEPYYAGNEDAECKIAVLDLGVKRNILNSMADRGAYLKIFPAETNPSEIEKWKPDGFFLSNGPGDPEPMDYAVDTAKYFIERDYPVFGICLGHQIIARSIGISTYKMHHGHRGANHPVINLQTGKSEITTQNHGFGLDPESLEKLNGTIEITHINLNDDSIEGIRMKNKNTFSVQFHPEASPGPHDSRYLFDDFISMIKAVKNNVRN